ncbi:hypothetical protein [Acidithiobacillus sp.]|uniref:hypothetical protein n=1 Tax=Acidithiobacillus sp. TaxID=1872118 RepID=UPI0025850124|nr:hypothetical protein [Acidithiobacillus sp.]MDD5375748.1 hypothetical protein [Acidithiobacillus sp.]
MIRCPLGGYCYKSRNETRSEDSFELFHVYRDAFAKWRGWSNVYAKNWLCVHHGVAVEYEPGKFVPPKWPGLFVEVDDWIHFRKSTLAYSKEEMARLIDATALAIIEAGGEVPA